MTGTSRSSGLYINSRFTSSLQSNSPHYQVSPGVESIASSTFGFSNYEASFQDQALLLSTKEQESSSEHVMQESKLMCCFSQFPSPLELLYRRSLLQVSTLRLYEFLDLPLLQHQKHKVLVGTGIAVLLAFHIMCFIALALSSSPDNWIKVALTGVLSLLMLVFISVLLITSSSRVVLKWFQELCTVLVFVQGTSISLTSFLETSEELGDKARCLGPIRLGTAVHFAALSSSAIGTAVLLFGLKVDVKYTMLCFVAMIAFWVCSINIRNETEEFELYWPSLLLIGFVTISVLVLGFVTEYQQRIEYLEQLTQTKHTQNKLSRAKRELKLAATEANNNEVRLLIEQATAQAERISSGALSALDKLRVNFDQIVLDKLIGSGSFGEVYSGQFEFIDTSSHHTVDIRAGIKRIIKSRIGKDSLEAMIGEILIMSSLRHKNIVQLYGWTSEPYVCLVLELMEKGSLRQVLDSMRNNESLTEGWNQFKSKAAIDIALGMVFIHARGIMHRDLKTDNLLVNDSFVVKIADFGSARKSDTDLRMTQTGSPFWMAPEIVKHEGVYCEKADVWSFAVVLIELFTTRLPYQKSDGKSCFNYLSVLDGKLSPLDAVELSSPRMNNKYNEFNSEIRVLELAKSCCQIDPTQRPKMREVLFSLFDIAVSQDTALDSSSERKSDPLLPESNLTGPNLQPKTTTHGSSLMRNTFFNDGVDDLHHVNHFDQSSNKVRQRRLDGVSESSQPVRRNGGLHILIEDDSSKSPLKPSAQSCTHTNTSNWEP